MRTDTEIKIEGFETLSNTLEMFDAERFISLIQKEKFDYTKWRENLFNGLSGEKISNRAMAFQKRD